MFRQFRWFAAVFVPFSLATIVYASWPRELAMPSKPPAIPPATLQLPVPPVPELPPSEPSSQVPILSEEAQANIERRGRAMAGELAKMWTRDPGRLVAVIDEAARNAEKSPSVALLLAIAHAETNGKILDVSEAGAVGLAQATPIAIRQEDIAGKMFVTPDYVTGARAYIMKKPLGDADTIASLLLTRSDSKTRARARRLLDSALALRLEGVSELDLLEAYGNEEHRRAVAEAKQANLRALRRLETLMQRGDRAAIRTFRDQTRRQYRALKQIQVISWRKYQRDLIAKRDRMLEAHFGTNASTIKRTRPYDAGEYLGEHLDIRFSATKMATFLVRHLDRKSAEAQKLAGRRGNVEEMTAALYNGGSHNVKRMLAGLIASLPETQRYMKKVPATRRRLERSVSIAGATLDMPRGNAAR